MVGDKQTNKQKRTKKNGITNQIINSDRILERGVMMMKSIWIFHNNETKTKNFIFYVINVFIFADPNQNSIESEKK